MNDKNENSDWINHLLYFRDCVGHLGDINIIDAYGSQFIYEERTCRGKTKVLRIENCFTLESQTSNLSIFFHFDIYTLYYIIQLHVYTDLHPIMFVCHYNNNAK